jgi:hypothetical protein
VEVRQQAQHRLRHCHSGRGCLFFTR